MIAGFLYLRMMNYFYNEFPESITALTPEESNHCIKVLRKKRGDQIDIIDGKGHVFSAEIIDDNARKCSYKILDVKNTAKRNSYHSHIAIAPTKNHDRLEWFVEKSCELGINEISIVTTKRTERKNINLDRLEKKAISALKQSKNLFKTDINNMLTLNDFLKSHIKEENRFIAFVDYDNPNFLHQKITKDSDILILIGPEGDFTPEEVELANSKGFDNVSLGKSILRTETAGVIAMHTINIANEC